jgi:hypothetical protein
VVFEWDYEKNIKNIKKHGISFEVAKYVFNDDNYIELYDYIHSSPTEDRYIAIGEVADVLYVVFTERGENIRIISARVATPQERREYYDSTRLY